MPTKDPGKELLRSYLKKHKNNGYQFRVPKDGYLSYRRQFSPKVRKFLNFIFKVLGWLLTKRDENDRVNKRILEDLGLPRDTSLHNLDAFFKREFRKKKYIFFFKPGVVKNFKPPARSYNYLLPGEFKAKTKTSSIEFLKIFSQ